MKAEQSSERAEDFVAAPVAGQMQQSWRLGYWGVGPGGDWASGQDPNCPAEVLPVFFLAAVWQANCFGLPP